MASSARACNRGGPSVGPSSDAIRIECLVRDNYAVVWRLARRWGLSAADADDISQRAVIVASQRLAEIRPGCERAFLCRTALFLASRARRHQRYLAEQSVEGSEETISKETNPEQLLEQKRARIQLDEFLAELPDDLRAVFVLFELELLGQAEVSEILEIPQGTVASRLRRARDEVSKLIERHRHQHIRTGAGR